MKARKRTVAAGVVAGLAVAGGGAAVAATQGSPSDDSKAVVADAAKELGVTPAQLTQALQNAMAKRIDAAVAAGRLTEEQGEAAKERLRSGDVPLLAPGHRGLHGLHGPLRAGLDAAAGFLGVTEAELREQLREGKTLAEVAEAEGRSVDGLVDAIVAAQRERLDAAVAAGRLTEAQKAQVLERMEERVEALVNGELRGRGPRLFRFGGRHADDERGPWS